MPAGTLTSDQSTLLQHAMLRVTEIFYSLQGETSRIGLPTVFVRLTGCPLRCGYCDTAYAFHGGESMTVGDVLANVAAHGVRHVTVTGGEPLAQKSALPLLAALADTGYSVSLETSGALDVSAVDARVSRIVDIKTPGSGEAEKNRWSNLTCLTAHDEIKFVVSSRADYDWAKTMMEKHRLAEKAKVILSPVIGRLAPALLAQWLMADALEARLQLQLHTLLWPETKRGV